MKLRYTPQAVADMQEIKRYIQGELKNPQAARRIAKSILDTCAMLKRFPEIGVRIAEKTGFDTDLRMLVCGQYIALYRVDAADGMVSVARVVHARQDYLRVLFDE